jgi:hypothetical protein
LRREIKIHWIKKATDRKMKIATGRQRKDRER